MSDELKDEIEALDAIYPGSIVRDGGMYKLELPDCGIKAQISFPSSYPEEPPKILSATKMEDIFKSVLDTVFVPGQVCMFDFLEKIREILENLEEEGEEEPEKEPIEGNYVIDEDIFAGWTESEPILDRKSLFIARAAHVKSTQEAAEKVAKLKYDKRIARAAHNITAWRINHDAVIQDCDDDGETAAGGRLLHLLQLTDCWNVVVCVSRWFGGVHLGPDR